MVLCDPLSNLSSAETWNFLRVMVRWQLECTHCSLAWQVSPSTRSFHGAVVRLAAAAGTPA